MQTLSLSYFERNKVGHLQSRMTNDVLLIQNSASKVTDAVTAPASIIGGTVLIFIQNWRLAIISVVVFPLMAYAIARIGRGMRSLSDAVQRKLADISAVFQETIAGVRIVKSFGMEDNEVARFRNENDLSYKAAMRSVRRSAMMSPSVEFIGVGGIALVLLCGGHLVGSPWCPKFRPEDLTSFVYLLYTIYDGARGLGGISVTYHQTLAGAERIFEVLDERSEVQESADPIVLPPSRGHVEFKDVSFAYIGNAPVLRGISFTMEPGQQVAIVGPSGAGKSTIANLIPRFYDISDGAILVDDVDIRDATLKSLRHQIGIVPQETILFSSSIKDNIAYGRMDATDEEIYEAARSANAHDFINKLPDGYDTLVGERGVRLSGGERQRVAIARAILKDPKLLILDEATSSLDVSSESIVQEALERLMRARTTLVIAHRLSTVVNAHKILVLKHGVIVESGTHHELLSQGGLYAQLYTVQSKGNLPEIVTNEVAT
jgi:subfamily B ATP-binding cassette protein MsbA